MKQIEPHDHWIFEMREARAEYEQQKLEAQQDECPHDEHDHGICLECGKDIMDDIVGRAELWADDIRESDF